MRHRRIGPLAGAGLGLGLVAIASGQTQCFFPNGTDALRTNPNGDFFPCEYPGLGMCCASLDDRCLGALCWSSTTNGLYRGGCTDTAWESEECLHLCTGGEYLGMLGFFNLAIGRPGLPSCEQRATRRKPPWTVATCQ
ncbi:hypothetical protein VD0002_g10330 [Verticillium dahliae]|nr:hypothetical protein VD0002_g10330 [Verticillium dahliae]